MATQKLVGSDVGRLLAEHINANQSSITTVRESLSWLTDLSDEEKTAWLATLQTTSNNNGDDDGTEATPQIIIDDAYDTTSSHAIQNKVVAASIAAINATLATIQADLTSLKEAVEELNGSDDEEGSVSKQIHDAIKAVPQGQSVSLSYDSAKDALVLGDSELSIKPAATSTGTSSASIDEIVDEVLDRLPMGETMSMSYDDEKDALVIGTDELSIKPKS